MAASLEDLKRWFADGKRQRCTHMIIVCDTFDWQDYPIYAKVADARQKYEEHNGKNMQKVMEVYDLRLSMVKQMKPGTRVFNLPKEGMSR
jgi:hypothetical protein